MPKHLASETKPYLSGVDVHLLGSTDQVARGIITARDDLRSSVALIMDADLDAEVVDVAIRLFRDSLTGLDRRHRDPRMAIATATRRAARAQATASPAPPRPIPPGLEHQNASAAAAVTSDAAEAFGGRHVTDEARRPRGDG